MKKTAFLLVVALLCALALAGCGEVTLSKDEINTFEVNDGPYDFTKVGEALNGNSDIFLQISGENAADVVDSLASFGTVSGTNLTFELILNGDADWAKLADLASVGGLTKLIVSGENSWSDLTPLLALEDMTALQLKQQQITDYTPLFSKPNLATLSLDMASYDFDALLTLPVNDIEIPQNDDLWVALDLLKTNPYLSTINTVAKDDFTAAEALEGDAEKTYYYRQFADVFRVTGYNDEVVNGTAYTKATGTPTLRPESLILVAPYGVLQSTPYGKQQMLKTASGLEETASDYSVFYPYIAEYEEGAEDAGIIKLAGTEVMDKKFLTAVSCEGATQIAFFILTDPANDYQPPDNYITPASTGYIRILDLKKGVFYPSARVIKAGTNAGDEAYYQQAFLTTINTYLNSLPVEGEID